MLRLDLPGHARRTPQTFDPTARGGLPAEEIDRIQAAVMAHSRPGPCPRCGVPLTKVRVDEGEDSDHSVWLVECPSGDFHVTLRAFEHNGPRAPLFDTLVVSKKAPHRFRRAATQSVPSLTVHAVLIYLAILATGGAVTAVVETRDTTMVYLDLKDDQQKPDEPESEPPAQELVSLAPPPKGFQTLDVPLQMPSEIPPVDLSVRFDPRDFSGVGVEGGVFEGVEGGLGEVSNTIGLPMKTYLESAVDEVPELLSHPPLRYPEFLRKSGLEGSVQLEFVVDTNGVAEGESMKVIHAAERAFEAPAISMIQGSRFRPGRVLGRKVRVLVRMDVVFTLLER